MDLRSSEGCLLEVRDIAKSFGGVRALDGVSFKVGRGTIKALIGPNGAGKTTLLNIVNGIIRADKGTILYKGLDITNMRSDAVAKLGIARTFQIVRVFTVHRMTVLDNVMVGGHTVLSPSVLGALFRHGWLARKERGLMEKALRLLSILGLEEFAYRPAAALPFGSQRLLELARALMMDPELLLLDEPASGLSEPEVEDLKGLLLSLRGSGLTMLLVEHNVRFVADLADEVVALNFGRKLAEGRPDEVFQNEAVLEAYLGRGMRWTRG